MIRAEPTYDVLQHARQRQQTPTFKELYAKRAGIEGTLSEACAGLWTATISLCGRSENTLPNVHDGSRHQCRSHWGLDRGTATRANPSLWFCCPGTNWVMVGARIRQQNLDNVGHLNWSLIALLATLLIEVWWFPRGCKRRGQQERPRPPSQWPVGSTGLPLATRSGKRSWAWVWACRCSSVSAGIIKGGWREAWSPMSTSCT